jgi:hypothetical protein
MQVADAEVLLDDISDFGDGLVAQDFRVGQRGGRGVLAHVAILDVVEGKKFPVGLSGVALAGKDLFDLLFYVRVNDNLISRESGALQDGTFTHI